MFDSDDLLRILPHRVPALYLDRVTELFPGGARGYKNVTINEPQFKGHFVGNPIMPGVLTLEALVQLVWVVVLTQGLDRAELPREWCPPKRDIELSYVDRLRFRGKVKPGDRLDLLVMTEEPFPDVIDNGCLFKVEARVGEQVCCEAVLTVRLG